MFYVVYLVDFKKNIIVPENWILHIQDHLEKFINNGLNKNQTFACFFTNNPMAFHENGTPRTDFRPSCNNQFSEQFPDEGLYMVKLKRFQSKFVK